MSCTSGSIATGELGTVVTTIPPPLVAGTDTGTAVGTLGGAFAVTGDGAATYAIPLAVPKGRAGLEPNLSLAYSSRGGNGLAGVGWSLTGLSSVARCPRSLFRDGEVRPVQFGGQDNFCLDGARLIKIGNTSVGTCGALTQEEYRTEPDSFLRVVMCGADAAGPLEWIVYSKDGHFRRYGGADLNARLDVVVKVPDGNGNPGTTTVVRRPLWLLARVQDRAGMSMTYSYGRTSTSLADKLEWWPTQIDYTGFGSLAPNRSVTFDYDVVQRTDAPSTFLRGIELTHRQRLVSITMKAPNPPEQQPARPHVRQYELQYTCGIADGSAACSTVTSTATGRSLLASATECDGFGVCLNPTRFTYSTSSPYFSGTPVGNAPSLGSTSLFGTDVTGDGKDDLLYNNRDTANGRFNDEYVQIAGEGGAWFGAPKPTPASNTQPATRIPYDVNADGKVDFVSDWCSHKTPIDPDGSGGICDQHSASVVFSDGSGHFPAGWSKPVCSDSSDGCKSWKATGVVDLNGDLEGDIVGGFGYDIAVGLGFRTPAFSPFRLVDPKARPPWLVGGPRYHDMDGDGTTDVLVPYDLVPGHPAGSLSRYDAVHVRGSNTAPTIEATPLGFDLKPNNCQLFVDVNGDGLADVVDLESGANVSLNRGDGRFVSSQNWAPGFSMARPDGTSLCASYHNLGFWWLGWNQTAVIPVDYNGDGLQDLLILQPVGSSSEVARVLVSTGSGFSVRSIDTIPLSCARTDTVAPATVLDANGDGLFDVVFRCPATPTSPPYFQLYAQGAADVSAAGRPDVLTEVRDGFNALARAVRYKVTTDPSVYTPGDVRHALPMVVSGEWIDDGNGNVLEVARHTYEGGAIGANAEGWLGFHSHTTLDPRTNAQRRVTYVTDPVSIQTFLGGRAFHAFTGQILEDLSYVPVDGVVRASRSTISPAYSFESYPGGVTNYFTYTASVRTESFETAAGSFRPDSPGVPLATTNTETSVNRCGDPLTVIVDRAPGAPQPTRTTTTRTFSPDPAATSCSIPNEWMDMLTRESTLSEEGGKSDVRAMQYVYESDGTGRVRDTIRQPDGPDNERRTTHIAVRDGFGNPAQIDVTGYVPAAGPYPARWETRTTLTSYDDDGVFATRTTNALGQLTTSNVHPGLGVVYAVTEPSLLLTTNQYDGFGRVVLTTSFDGRWTKTDYLTPSSTGAAASCNTDGYTQSSFAIVENTTASDGRRTLVCRDRLGRPIRKASLLPSGALSYVDTTFLASFPDRVDQITRPHIAGTPGYIAAKYVRADNHQMGYDNAGRVISICHATSSATSASDLGACAITTYSMTSAGLPQTDTYDENQVVGIQVHRRSVMSSTGMLQSTSIFPNGVEAKTQFTYGPFDTTIGVKDAALNVVSQEFDSLGRRSKLIDADVGQIATVFDAFDQVVSETQNDGTATAIAYDKLGRVTARSASDGTDSFAYVASGTATGQLQSQQRVTTNPASNIQQTYVYTPKFGRLQTETWAIDGASYAFDYTYDEQGRLATTAYPDVPQIGRLQTQNIYNAAGALSEVDPLHAPTGAPAYLWKLVATDAEGHATDESLAPPDATTPSGVRRVNRYFDGTGQLKATGAQDLAGQWIVREEYAYDPNGNLHTRSDTVQNKSETFGYDGASRLTSVSGPTNITYAYDSLGNLTSSTEPGLAGCTLKYGEPQRAAAGDPRRMGPHALTSQVCGTNVGMIRYETRGNVTESTVGARLQNTAYTSFNKPARLDTVGQVHEVFEYDASHFRVKKIASNTTAIPSVTYVKGLFEQRQVPGSSAVDYVYIVPRVGQLIVRFDAGSTTGVPIPLVTQTDLLGSPIATMDLRGAIQERMSFDAFGRRRNSDWTYPSTLTGPAPSNTKVGYTGHNNDDEMPTVDMGGRMYDPIFKHFYQPDPFVQVPAYGPSWNRYSYVMNNPLGFTDPDGYGQCQNGGLSNRGIVACVSEYDETRLWQVEMFSRASDISKGLRKPADLQVAVAPDGRMASAGVLVTNVTYATYQWSSQTEGVVQLPDGSSVYIDADGAVIPIEIITIYEKRPRSLVIVIAGSPKTPPSTGFLDGLARRARAGLFRIVTAIAKGRAFPVDPKTGARKKTPVEKVVEQTENEDKQDNKNPGGQARTQEVATVPDGSVSEIAVLEGSPHQGMIPISVYRPWSLDPSLVVGGALVATAFGVFALLLPEARIAALAFGY